MLHMTVISAVAIMMATMPVTTADVAASPTAEALRPHWIPRHVDSGKMYSNGNFHGESRPVMWADMEHIFKLVFVAIRDKINTRIDIGEPGQRQALALHLECLSPLRTEIVALVRYIVDRHGPRRWTPTENHQSDGLIAELSALKLKSNKKCR